MRRPTPYELSHAWYLDAMAGGKPAITHEAQCGWFKRRLIKHGPWVPVVIFLESERDEEGALAGPETVRCIVNGKYADPDDQWTYVATTPITVGEFDYLVDLAGWAKKNDEREPLANPRKAINHLQTPIPVFKRKRK